MNTEHQCLLCAKEMKNAGITTYQVTPETGLVRLRLTTEPMAFATCAKGHKSAFVILDGAYALLFERALQRLVTAQTRDAVLDAYTAFEMYMSHVPARARYDRELGASPRALRKELKTGTRSTERAIGASLSVVSLVTGKAPPKLPEAATGLRNDAAHAGLYPDEKAAEKACLEIYKFVTEVDRRLDALPCVNPTDYWQASIDEEVDECFDRNEMAGLAIAHRSMATCLACNRGRDRCEVTIEDTIARYREDAKDGYAGWPVW